MCRAAAQEANPRRAQAVRGAEVVDRESRIGTGGECFRTEAAGEEGNPLLSFPFYYLLNNNNNNNNNNNINNNNINIISFLI